MSPRKPSETPNKQHPDTDFSPHSSRSRAPLRSPSEMRMVAVKTIVPPPPTDSIIADTQEEIKKIVIKKDSLAEALERRKEIHNPFFWDLIKTLYEKRTNTLELETFYRRNYQNLIGGISFAHALQEVLTYRLVELPTTPMGVVFLSRYAKIPEPIENQKWCITSGNKLLEGKASLEITLFDQRIEKIQPSRKSSIGLGDIFVHNTIHRTTTKSTY